jgi:hypothetical protein
VSFVVYEEVITPKNYCAANKVLDPHKWYAALSKIHPQ